MTYSSTIECRSRRASKSPSSEPASFSFLRSTSSSFSAWVFGSIAARIFWRRIFSSSMSWTRMPRREALSA